MTRIDWTSRMATWGFLVAGCLLVVPISAFVPTALLRVVVAFAAGSYVISALWARQCNVWRSAGASFRHKTRPWALIACFVLFAGVPAVLTHGPVVLVTMLIGFGLLQEIGRHSDHPATRWIIKQIPQGSGPF